MGSGGWVNQKGNSLTHGTGHFTSTTSVASSTAVPSNHSHLEGLVNQIARWETGECAWLTSFLVWLMLLLGRQGRNTGGTTALQSAAVREASGLTNCILSTSTF